MAVELLFAKVSVTLEDVKLSPEALKAPGLRPEARELRILA